MHYSGKHRPLSPLLGEVRGLVGWDVGGGRTVTFDFEVSVPEQTVKAETVGKPLPGNA